MSKAKIAILTCALSVGAAAYAVAQEAAVLMLRSGEKVRGELVDMGADFIMNVNGQDRHVPIGDVILIDFVGGAEGLPSTETTQIPADRHMLFLRGGQHVQGWLKDIGGSRPLHVIFASDAGEKTYTSGEVGRIYLGRRPEWVLAPPAGPVPVPTTGTTPPGQNPPAGSIGVMGNQAWTPTNIFVREGDLVTFEASGQVRLGTDADDLATPGGSSKRRYASNAVLPASLAGALIARVGDGAPFLIGSQMRVRMPTSGPLFLGINDDGFADNAGQFDVLVNARRRGR